MNAPIVHHRLFEQYRMHPDICQWPNQFYYDNRIVSSIDNIVHDNCALRPFTVISVTGREASDKEDDQEIAFIIDFVRTLLAHTNTCDNTLSYGLVTPFPDIQGKLQQAIRYGKCGADVLIHSSNMSFLFFRICIPTEENHFRLL